MLKTEYGQEHVLCTKSPTFFEDLRTLAKKLSATVFIDAVAGDMTGKTMECLPARSKCIFYGFLSEQGPSEIDPLLLIGRNYSVDGFVLGEYLESKGLGILSVLKKMNVLMQ